MTVAAFLEEVYTVWALDRRRDRMTAMLEPVRYTTREESLPVLGLRGETL